MLLSFNSNFGFTPGGKYRFEGDTIIQFEQFNDPENIFEFARVLKLGRNKCMLCFFNGDTVTYHRIKYDITVKGNYNNKRISLELLDYMDKSKSFHKNFELDHDFFFDAFMQRNHDALTKKYSD
ncbi:MAG: hypothetical protein JXB49_19010 [Bacteroidales bacterium]|nr:hypothetical protein [Bacteroidales bacterium]